MQHRAPEGVSRRSPERCWGFHTGSRAQPAYQKGPGEAAKLGSECSRGKQSQRGVLKVRLPDGLQPPHAMRKPRREPAAGAQLARRQRRNLRQPPPAYCRQRNPCQAPNRRVDLHVGIRDKLEDQKICSPRAFLSPAAGRLRGSNECYLKALMEKRKAGISFSVSGPALELGVF